MIGLLFTFGTETIEIRIIENNLLFRTSNFPSFTTIDGLKLDKIGCIKENPDLKDSLDWRQETIKRFKDKIKKMETEMEKVEYVIKELSPHGYKLNYIQKKGSRPIKMN